MLLVENSFSIDSLVVRGDVAFLMMAGTKVEEVLQPASGTLEA